MNILFVSNQIYPCSTGGTEVFNYHLASALSGNNRVTLFTHCGRADSGIELVTVPATRPIRYTVPLRLLAHIIKNRNRIDVIFLSYMRSHWFWWSLMPLVKKLLGIEYVITIHGGGLTVWKPFFLYRWSFRNAFRLIGISERICREYRRRTGREVEYIPPLFPFSGSEKSAEELKKAHGLPADSKVILYVGSLKELKSPSTLIKAFNSLDPDFVKEEGLYLLLAGGGALREELEGAVEYPERTRFLGYVARERMPELYGLADIYVITSRFEGTPLSVLEAVYNGIPVIGSDVEGINAIIENGKNGLLFEFGDHRGLASAIRRLAENPAQGASLAKEAEKTRRRRYRYEEVPRRYQEIFSEVKDES